MMTSRERLLKVLNGEVPDRTPVTLFVTDTDIEDGPPNCVLDRRTHDTIEDLIKFHEVLSIDIMLRISVDVFEPIAFDHDTDDWVNAWEISTRSQLLEADSARLSASKVRTFTATLRRTG